MERARFFLIPIFTFITLLTCKETDIKTGNLKITVRGEDEQPLAQAVCQFTMGQKTFSKLTNLNGELEISNIESGRWLLVISKDEHIPRSEEIEVGAASVFDFTLSSLSSFLTISGHQLSFDHLAGEQDIKVSSNTSWTITNEAPWVQLSSSSGTGNSNVKISWDASNEGLTREANVIFEAGSIRRTLTLEQTPKFKLLSYETVIGNHENDSKDSVVLLFNSPITVNSIKAGYELCLSEIRPIVKGNRVSFAYSCARMGESYPFSISVKGGSEIIDMKIEAQFFHNRAIIPGRLVDYFITEDNQSLWGITDSPNKVIRFSISAMKVIDEFELDFIPVSIEWDHFKNRLFIFRETRRCDYSKIVTGNCNNFLLSLDPATSEFTKSIIELIDNYDGIGYGYPYVFPTNVCLFKNGTGIVLLQEENRNNGWRYIDSWNHDSTYVSGIHFNPPHDIRYQSIHLNYNKTKIYMMRPWGSTVSSPFLVQRQFRQIHY